MDWWARMARDLMYGLTELLRAVRRRCTRRGLAAGTRGLAESGNGRGAAGVATDAPYDATRGTGDWGEG